MEATERFVLALRKFERQLTIRMIIGAVAVVGALAAIIKL